MRPATRMECYWKFVRRLNRSNRLKKRFLASLRNDSGGGRLDFCPIGNNEISRWRFEMTKGGGIRAFALPGTTRFLASLEMTGEEG